MKEVRRTYKEHAMRIALECAFEQNLEERGEFPAADEIPEEKTEKIVERIKEALKDSSKTCEAGALICLSDEEVCQEDEKER